MKKAVVNERSMHVLPGQRLPLYIQLEVHRSDIFVSSLYNDLLNLTDIVFPMTLNQIRKFENQNNILINVYCIEEQKEKKRILPLWLTNMKRNKHVNLLYVQDLQNDYAGHFAWIKDLSCLVNS